MKYTYFLENPNFTINNIHFENVARDKGFKYHYKCRQHSAFIYVVSGMMQYVFTHDSKNPIYVSANELVFVPQNSDYVGTYYEENTEIKLIQFDLSGEDIPPYLRSYRKILFPKIADSGNDFFKWKERFFQQSFRFPNRCLRHSAQNSCFFCFFRLFFSLGQLY